MRRWQEMLAVGLTRDAKVYEYGPLCVGSGTSDCKPGDGGGAMGFEDWTRRHPEEGREHALPPRSEDIWGWTDGGRAQLWKVLEGWHQPFAYALILCVSAAFLAGAVIWACNMSQLRTKYAVKRCQKTYQHVSTYTNVYQHILVSTYINLYYSYCLLSITLTLLLYTIINYYAIIVIMYW